MLVSTGLGARTVTEYLGTEYRQDCKGSTTILAYLWDSFEQEDPPQLEAKKLGFSNQKTPC